MNRVSSIAIAAALIALPVGATDVTDSVRVIQLGLPVMACRAPAHAAYQANEKKIWRRRSKPRPRAVYPEPVRGVDRFEVTYHRPRDLL